MPGLWLGLLAAGWLVGPGASWVLPVRRRPAVVLGRPRAVASMVALQPRQLTYEITRSNSSEQLLILWAEHQGDFNTLHISAFWNRLGKLVRYSRAEQTWVRSNGKAMAPVREHTLRMLPELGPRSLSNTAHGLASARMWSRPPWSAVWETMAVCASNQSAQYQPQNLANLAWAYATVGHPAPHLFRMIERESKGRVGEFAAQGLTNLVWAFASVGHAAPDLFEAVAAHATANISQFSNTQGLVNLAWGFATNHHPSPALFGVIARMLETRVGQCTSQGLAISAWAFATAGHADSRLFNAIAESAVGRVSSFQTQGLANLVWGMATAGHTAPELFASVAREAQTRLPDFQTQGLANTAWAFAKAGCADERLFAAFATAVPARLALMSTQELANLAWAFATAGYATPELFNAIGDAAVPRLAEMKEQEIANLAWAFATAGLDHPAVLDRIADEAERRMQRLAPQGMANLAWAFAIVGGLPPTKAAPRRVDAIGEDTGGGAEAAAAAALIRKLAAAGEDTGGGGLADTGVEGLAEAAAALNGSAPVRTAGPGAGGGPRRRFAGYFSALAREMADGGRAPELSSQGLAIVSWAFATLGHTSAPAFTALGEVILTRLDELSSLGLTNIAWAFATAGHGDLIFGPMSIQLQSRLPSFKAKDLAVTAWAFATAGRVDPPLFDAIVHRAVPMLPDFSTQGLANLAWAFASVARADEAFFLPLGEEVAQRLGTLNSQELANTAWAFAVADVRCHTLFGPGSQFVQVCGGDAWNDKQLCQLHQWTLWRDEVAGRTEPAAALAGSAAGGRGALGAYAGAGGGAPLSSGGVAPSAEGSTPAEWPSLPLPLRSRAERAFLSAGLCPSRMQRSVQQALESLGLRVAEEVRIAQGYSIDLAVEWGDVLVGVEVDGPSHFIGSGQPTGSTLLKRRQLRAFGWPLVSVPYFEWEARRAGFGDRFEQRQAECAYLAALLDGATGLRTSGSGDGWVAIDCRRLLEEEEEEEGEGDVPSYAEDGADPADPCHAPPDAGVPAAPPGHADAPPPEVRPTLL